ncbi:hypothetical protein [Clostridium sp. E02]|uniref:hypothetical protein n=1 Tax=Clostridium sp. E02 TaxID=2487134 RepID=UPI0013DD89CF|nr:hypothetical protein [Clostridium sp. E02]
MKQVKAKHKKLKFGLKTKIYLTIVLPIIIVTLFLRVLETYLRIMIRKLFLPSSQAEDS